METGVEEALPILPDAQKDSMESQQDVNGSPSQQSVIQSTPQIVQFTKGNVIYVNKTGSVIQSTSSPGLQAIQVIDGDVPEDEAARRRREILTRRPSYRKILNDLGGDVSEDKGDAEVEAASDAYQHNGNMIKVLPAANIQIAGESMQNLQALTMPSGSNGNTVVHYTQQGGDGQFYVPVSIPTVSGGLKLDQSPNQHMLLTTSPTPASDLDGSVKKREVRLYKNREAARECRRKKKEYIKCLESRVAVLENQNKALIEELKSLKELYCQKKLP